MHEKQRQLEDMADRGEKMGKGLFVGFTFRHKKPSPNGEEKDRVKEDDGGFNTMI